ncbi:MAG: hypothetical protein HY761_01625 [Candidatus Omnitrophica bacterium]|nr:hypothetical protein [Candidatus Omnitrophota bacterium]
MPKKNVFIILTGVFLFFAGLSMAFGQQQTAQPVQAQEEPEVQWVWGEVVSVDPQNKIFSVKYLDYETDEEKEIAVNVDEKTIYENVKAIGEIKTKDAVSIDYIVTPEGRNVARNISLEKPEVPPATVQPPSAVTAAPEIPAATEEKKAE